MASIFSILDVHSKQSYSLNTTISVIPDSMPKLLLSKLNNSDLLSEIQEVSCNKIKSDLPNQDEMSKALNPI